MAEGRRALRLWHRWFGLTTGLWLFLLAVTGSAITYYEELDTALNPDLRRAAAVAGPPHPAPITRGLEAVRTALPGFEPRQIDLPDYASESVWMIGSAPMSGEWEAVQAFTHPQTGELLGWRRSEGFALDRRRLPDLLYGLHVDLLIAPWVTAIFGFISLLWLLDHGFAAALAIPKIARWREAFWVKGRAGGLRRLYDWHRAPGLWFFPVTFVLALTGVTLAWPEISRSAVRTVAPVSERLDFEFPTRPVDAPAVSIEAAMARVAPSAQVDSLRPLPAKGVYAVRTFHPRDPDYQGRMWTYVDMTDGRIVAQRHDNGSGPGDTFFAWQFPLHSGQAFGEIGRALVFLGGVACAWLCGGGLLLWLRRRRPLLR